MVIVQGTHLCIEQVVREGYRELTVQRQADVALHPAVSRQFPNVNPKYRRGVTQH